MFTVPAHRAATACASPQSAISSRPSPADAPRPPRVSGAGPDVLPLPPASPGGDKAAYTTGGVDLSRATHLLTRGRPRPGDLVLARVEELGQHAKLENPQGRRVPLHVGDRVIVSYAARYAPDQFEAVVPEDLGPCELVAAGGIAARVVSAHAAMKPATRLRPLGLLLDGDGRGLSVADGALPLPSTRASGVGPVVVAVLGSSMNSGKTTTGAQLCQGVSRAGLRVGAAKVTGTGAGGDVWMFRDHGAHPVHDFTDAGHPSTYRIGADAVLDIFTQSLDRLAAAGCEVAVIEVADGVFQRETATLVSSPEFRERVDGILFAATDALCGVAGLGWLEERGLRPLAVTGVVSASPLASRELVDQTGAQVWPSAVLADQAHAARLISGLRAEASRTTR